MRNPLSSDGCVTMFQCRILQSLLTCKRGPILTIRIVLESQPQHDSRGTSKMPRSSSRHQAVIVASGRPSIGAVVKTRSDNHADMQSCWTLPARLGWKHQRCAIKGDLYLNRRDPAYQKRDRCYSGRIAVRAFKFRPRDCTPDMWQIVLRGCIL